MGVEKSITFSVSDLASTLNLLASFYKPARATKININCPEVMGKVSRVLKVVKGSHLSIKQVFFLYDLQIFRMSTKELQHFQL